MRKYGPNHKADNSKESSFHLHADRYDSFTLPALFFEWLAKQIISNVTSFLYRYWKEPHSFLPVGKDGNGDTEKGAEGLEGRDEQAFQRKVNPINSNV